MKIKTDTELVQVAFHGAPLYLVTHDGEPYGKRPAAPPVVFREARALLLLFRRGTRWRRGMGRNSGESILKLGVEVI